MRIEKVKTKDGKEFDSYHLEVGDVVTSRGSSIKEVKNLAIVNNRAVQIDNYGLSVTTKDGQDIYLKLTNGQKKGIERSKIADLTGHKIEAYLYKNKFGNQVGAKVITENK